MSIPIERNHPLDTTQILDRMLNAVLIFLLIHSVFTWLTHHYRIGYDSQTTLCLSGNHRWYLIDRLNRKPLEGDLVAFRSDQRMAPEIPVGTVMIKRVDAISGETVHLIAQGLQIQGQVQSIRYPHRDRLKTRALQLGSQLIIPEGGVWVMGDHPRSFDSRYFGPIEERQIIGVAHALSF